MLAHQGQALHKDHLKNSCSMTLCKNFIVSGILKMNRKHDVRFNCNIKILWLWCVTQMILG